MLYKLYTHEQKIPTIFALLILVAIVFIVSAFFRRFLATSSHKKIEDKITRIEVTNKTSSSFTTVLCTNETLPIYLKYGIDDANLNQTAFDDRDIKDAATPRLCHFITIKGLESTKYYIQAFSDGLPLRFSPLLVELSQISKRSTSLSPLWGRLVDQTGKPLESGIVVAHFDNSNPIATIIKKGEWLLPLDYLDNLPSGETGISLIVTDEAAATWTIKAFYKYSDELKKTLVFGKTYDLTKNPHGAEIAQSTNDNNLKKVDIIYPLENASIAGSKPLFRGVASPNEKVQLVLDFNVDKTLKEHKRRAFEFNANEKGVWSFVPNFDFAAGTHTVTIHSSDAQKKLASIKRSFTVLKSGEAVLGESISTPEATLTTTPQQPPVSQSPTITIEPTTPFQTLTPTPTLPQSGMNIYSLGLISIALIVFGVGLLFIF